MCHSENNRTRSIPDHCERCQHDAVEAYDFNNHLLFRVWFKNEGGKRYTMCDGCIKLYADIHEMVVEKCLTECAGCDEEAEEEEEE